MGLCIHFRWLIFGGHSLISLKTITFEIAAREDEWEGSDILPQIICPCIKRDFRTHCVFLPLLLNILICRILMINAISVLTEAYIHPMCMSLSLLSLCLFSPLAAPLQASLAFPNWILQMLPRMLWNWWRWWW